MLTKATSNPPLIALPTISLNYPIYPTHKLSHKYDDNDKDNSFAKNKKFEEDYLTSFITEHSKTEESLLNHKIELNSKEKKNLQTKQKGIEVPRRQV